MIEQRDGLSGQEDLALRGSRPDERSQLGDRERMKPQLWLVDHDQRGQLGLQQQRCQADEAQRSIRQRVRCEQRSIIPVAPREL